MQAMAGRNRTPQILRLATGLLCLLLIDISGSLEILDNICTKKYDTDTSLSFSSRSSKALGTAKVFINLITK